MDLTMKQFKEELDLLNEKDSQFNIESEGIGSVAFYFYGCSVSMELDDNECGNIALFKPNTLMDATIDLEVVDSIAKDVDGSFIVAFTNDMSDMIIKPVEQ